MVDDDSDETRTNVSTDQLTVGMSGMGHTLGPNGVDELDPARALYFKRHGVARYLDRGRLGAGGMGEVRAVFDTLLQRPVAMKSLRPSLLSSKSAVARFEAEATMTAGLAHPGIVPIHDRGVRSSGIPWYTMKLVRGRTLAEALESLVLRRRVDAFARVCEAMAYAHDQGVVHRDLKPQNIMLGRFGEVLVVDWGLARHVIDLGNTAPPRPAQRLIEQRLIPEADQLPDMGPLTRPGQVLGTPRYMAPEQFDPTLGAVGPVSDVYSLGATLHHLMAGQPPPTVQQVVIDGIPPLTGPQALIDIIARAMSITPRDRFGDAGEMAQAVREWLDGEARRERALELVSRADALRPESARLRAEADARATEADAVLSPLPPHAPVEQKRAGWALEDAAAVLRRSARLAEVQYIQTLRTALETAPGLAEARDRMNTYYRERLLDADARRDADAVAEFAALLESHDAAGNVQWLRGDGRLTLVTDPPGATCALFRYETRDRRLVPVPAGPLPSTPIIDHPLPMGSYLVEINAPGRMTVRYPVHIERQGVWDGIAPGDTAPTPIWLPEDGALGADECYVPAGWCIVGGDPDAPDGLPRQRVWIDAFAIGRFPVTHGQYLAWLNTLVESGREAEALSHVPIDGNKAQGPVRPAYRRRPDGWFALGRAQDAALHADMPAFAISWQSARSYTAWHTEVEGTAWSLAHSWQWEKAARGVDGRHFPWGDRFEPTWSAVPGSDPMRSGVRAISDFSVDESVYGVKGLAGNVRDFCSNVYTRRGPCSERGRISLDPPSEAPDELVMVKGGSYISQPSLCRVATRFAMFPHDTLCSVGFRLLRPPR